MWSICLLLLAQTTDPAIGSGDPSAELQADVRRLVRQLDDRERTQREAAEQQLIELGVGVLERLPPITPQTPAEMKERLERVRKTLETQQAASISNASLVTLQGEMPLADALQALQEQTDNRVEGAARRTATIKIAFDKTPYWQALDEILDQASLQINEYGGKDGVLVVQARPEGQRDRREAAAYAGVFRIEPLRLEARRDLRNPNVNVMQLTLGITWEPRVKPISLRQQLSNLEIVDDRGETLSVTGQQGTRNIPVEFGISAVEFPIPLALPSREVKEVATAKGQFTALVPGRVETFEFSNLGDARDVEQSRAGVTVTLDRVRKNIDLYQILVRVRFDSAGNALASHRGWVFQNEAYVIDGRGNRLENIGFEETRRDENEVGVAYLFDLAEGVKDCKFVYKTPALILDFPVDWELKNIQLP